MAVVWAHCKSKTVCEPDDLKDEVDPEADEPKRGHGGCGHIQPQIRKEGLKLFVQYKKTKDDDDVCSSCKCNSSI
jgi:DNA-directed RNA polymerase II subunit RPB1